MEVTTDVVDCSEYYSDGQMPKYVLPAIKPVHRNNRGMIVDVYEGEWWCLQSPDDPDRRWARSHPSSPAIRVPIIPYRTSGARYDTLVGLGLQLALDVLSSLDLPRIQRVHLVLGDTFPVAGRQLETWIGVACQMNSAT